MVFRSLSVCLSVTFVHCAQTAEDIDKNFSAYDSPLSLLDRIKIWLTSVNIFLPIFCLKVTHPLLIWASQIFSLKLRPNGYIAQRSQWRAYRKPTPLFWIVPSMTPYDTTFPKMGVPNMSNFEWPYLHSATGDPIHFMFGSSVDFQCRRIEWRCFGFNQIWWRPRYDMT